MKSQIRFTVATILLVTSFTGQAISDVRRERPLRRPYIVEIGEPYRISRATIDAESAKIDELRTYLAHYGYPDYAEIQEIRPEWPWESYEVRLYYLRRNTELDFGHVLSVDSAASGLGVLKFQGGIPASKRLQIEAALQNTSPPAPAPAAAAPASASQISTSLSTLVARVEAAAERAAQAAERAVEQSEAAARAADRTANIVDKLIETESANR
jgi:hypothetical protein